MADDSRWKAGGRDGKWPKIAKRILRRAGHQCEYTELGIRCVSAARDVDHIVPLFEGGTDADSNLQALCGRHHDAKTAHEGVRAWKAQREDMRRRFSRAEPHPGELV